MFKNKELINFETWKQTINEDVTIPSSLSQQYLAVKKQISDKQTKKDQILKAANQLDNEINILTNNLIAIETKAAEAQGQSEQEKIAQQKKEKPEATPTTESLDVLWNSYINENTIPDLSQYPQLDIFADPETVKPEIEDGEIQFSDDENLDFIKDYDDDFIEDNNDIEDNEERNDNEDNEESNDNEIEGDKSLEGDYVFTLEITEDDADENIIAKIYKDEDDDYWKVRVVQGNEEPLEDMKFEPELTKEEIIEKINEIPGFSEIEEIDTDEYEEMIDDKEEEDSVYYDDIVN